MTSADGGKIKLISQRLASVGITKYKDADISYALRAPYAEGDPEKAFSLMMLLKESEEGIIRPYKPNIVMLGAVNRESTTCYLDSLLFAMFARLACFEAMLYKTFDNDKKQRLATLLRLWINTLRLGKLITTDIVRQGDLVPELMTCLRNTRPNTSSSLSPNVDGRKPLRSGSRTPRKPSILSQILSTCPC